MLGSNLWHRRRNLSQSSQVSGQNQPQSPRLPLPKPKEDYLMTKVKDRDIYLGIQSSLTNRALEEEEEEEAGMSTALAVQTIKMA